MITRLLRTVLFIAFVFSTRSVHAACHVITQSGSGTYSGNDWNNASTGIPATLTRGDVYYLADGIYGDYTFNTSGSGTMSELRKAQTYDHCTDTGWNAATMGSGQARIRSLTIQANWFRVNGNGTQTTPGCGGAPGATVSAAPPNPKDCGILFDDQATGNNGPIYWPNNPAGNNYDFDYIEFKMNPTPSANDDTPIFSPFNITISHWNHIYGHNAVCVYFSYTGDHRTTENNYWWGTEVQGPSSDGCHGQYDQENNSTSFGIERKSVFRDISGTAVWTFQLGSGTHTNWQFYDNVIFNTQSGSWGGLSDGLIACINSGVNCNGFVFYQNTILNLGFGTGIAAPGATGINNENMGSYTVENNLWYANNVMPTFSPGTGGTYTQDHNSYLNNNTSTPCPSGTTDVCNQSSGNPFNNWPKGDFTLANDNSNWNNRVSLSSPYNIDAAGNTITTDRGAYQFSSTTQAVQPPSALLATVQ